MKYLFSIITVTVTLAACGGGGSDEPELPVTQNLPMVRLKGFPGMLLVQGCYHALTPDGLCSVIDTFGAPIKPGAVCKVPLDSVDQSCPVDQFVFELAPIDIPRAVPAPRPELL